MNKTQLVAAIANETGLPLSKAEKALAAAIDAITKTLKKGDTVTLIGFGNFVVRKRAARKVRNPQTGQEMTIKARIVPVFKAGKSLKETVDTKK